MMSLKEGLARMKKLVNRRQICVQGRVGVGEGQGRG